MELPTATSAVVKAEPQEEASLVESTPKINGKKLKKRGPRGSIRKTIQAPGLGSMRTAQACDRCRAKKSRCDGKQPACSSCAAAGLECVVLDRLTRKLYPKGYTELLEEQSRQLIQENARLKAALSLRDEQLAGGSKVTSPDPSLDAHLVLNTHIHEAGCACCAGLLAVHERPVSVAGSVYDMDAEEELMAGSGYSDFDETDTDTDTGIFTPQPRPAPGAFAAATAIAQMHRGSGQESKEEMLTALVAAAVPRSTEETLFIPTLLARVGEAYGYGSAPAKLTALAVALLQEMTDVHGVAAILDPLFVALLQAPPQGPVPIRMALPDAVCFLRQLKLPPILELDGFVATYFDTWGHSLPLVNKNAFLTNYPRLGEVLEHGFSSRAPEYGYELAEKLGAVCVLETALAMRLQKAPQFQDQKLFQHRLAHYDALIHLFIRPTCVLTHTCLLQLLQLLALALQYCLAAGDVATCFELRGRVVSMAQQLRLHRCPAAVLGLSKEMTDPGLKAFMQGERRVVFWCVYVLDVYSSLSLGVPRLLKDYEVECATPFSGKTALHSENTLVVNNTRLTIFGTVPPLALCVMQFAKVLGNIMDSIFLRSDNYNVHDRALEKDQMLDCWRRDLPPDLSFETDVNGLRPMDQKDEKKEKDKNGENELNADLDSDAYSGTGWAQYLSPQYLLIFLYFHAKILIYLPIISKYGLHHNVGLSAKERLARGHADVATSVSSTTLIHQAAVQLLRLLKNLATTLPHVLPLPLNIAREHARFAILVAKGSLDYIKGGPLHLQLKQLLLDTLPLLRLEAQSEIPCCITPRAATLLEYAVLSILGLNLDRVSAGASLRRRIITNESLGRVEPLRKAPPQMKQEFLNQQHQQNLPNLQTTPYDHERMQYTSLQANLLFGPAQNSSINIGNSQENIASRYSEQDTREGDMAIDEPADFFKFDDLLQNFGADVAGGQYVTDGSLGLVPFLNEPNDLFFE